MQTIRTNLTNGASSQYTNHNFNSMIVFNGTVLGAGPVGLRKLCCTDSDAGVAVEPSFTTVSTDFNIPDLKRLRRIYMQLESGSDVSIMVYVDDVLAGTLSKSITVSGKHRVAIPVNHSWKGDRWALRVSGKNLIVYGIYILPSFLHPGQS